MVLPLLAAFASGGAALWASDKLGLIDIEDAGEEMGEIVGKGVAGLAKAVPEIMDEPAPALVEGLSSSVIALRNAIKNNEQSFATGITIVLLSVSAWWTLKRLVLGPKISVN